MSSLALQKAVRDRLRNDAGVTALVGQRSYDQPPPSPQFPYITFGPDQTLPSRAGCYDGEEVTLQIDVWSRGTGFPEAKAIANAVKAALNDADLPVDGYRLLDFYFSEVRTFREQDGLTSHSALTFRALTEPAD